MADQRRRSLMDNGFLLLPELFTPDEVAEVEAGLGTLFEDFGALPPGSALDLGATEGEFGQDVPEILYPSVLLPALRRTAVFRRSLALARELLGPGTWFRFDHSIRKPPGCAYETVWHQDRVHKRSGLPERRLNVWIPTSPVGVADGCMRYVPGSHLTGVLPHEAVPGRRGALQAVGVDKESVVDCPVPLGGAALHLFETLHSAHPNLGERPRTAWILQFTQPRAGVPVAGWVHQTIHRGQTRQWRRDHREREKEYLRAE
jgi:phytanoyl-CoA hydroxylase